MEGRGEVKLKKRHKEREGGRKGRKQTKEWLEIEADRQRERKRV